MLIIKDLKLNLTVISFLMILSIFSTLQAKTKTYQVEILVFETKDETALSQSWPLKPGKPSIFNTVHIDSDKDANFTPLAENVLKLGASKQKIEKNYHLILHKGWRQTVSDKEGAFGVHVTGGVRYHPLDLRQQESKESPKEPVENTTDNTVASSTQPTQFEVEGIIKLSQARQLTIETDLVFRKPMLLISKNGQMGKFAEIDDQNADQNKENSKTTRLQAFRLTDTSPVILSDMHYIDHPLYGVIILVTSEKNQDLAN